MIHIGLHGDDRVLGMTISLPEVPRRGDFIRVGALLYRVDRITWAPDPGSYVPVVLELILDHHIS